jgi:hypothetical protein
MNPHDETRLEAAIDRELKALPGLRAPASLVSRVMATIEQASALPWYRRAWQTWPLSLQAVSMLTLLCAFTGLCIASWQLVHTPAVASAGHTVSGWVNSLGAICKVAGVVVNAAGHALQSLGPAVLVGGALAVGVGYAACVGLGTVYVRLAFARR